MVRQNRYFILTQNSINKILKANFFSIFHVKILDPGIFEIAAKNGDQKVIFDQICQKTQKIVFCRPFLAAISKIPGSIQGIPNYLEPLAIKDFRSLTS